MLAPMDPLGAVENKEDINTLQRWTATPVPEYDILVDNPESRKISPFKYSQNLNEKLILWCVITSVKLFYCLHASDCSSFINSF